MERQEFNIVSQSAIIDEIVASVEMKDEECCGFLFGKELPTQRQIDYIRAAANSAQRNRAANYEIDSRDYQEAEKFADENQMTMLGVYHSHLNCPAIPSAYDRIAAQPNFSYLIISVINGKADAVRSWRLNHIREFTEEILTIV